MIFGDNSESRVLAKRGGAWDVEEVTVEVNRERERRYEVEERGEKREERVRGEMEQQS